MSKQSQSQGKEILDWICELKILYAALKKYRSIIAPRYARTRIQNGTRPSLASMPVSMSIRAEYTIIRALMVPSPRIGQAAFF